MQQEWNASATEPGEPETAAAERLLLAAMPPGWRVLGRCRYGTAGPLGPPTGCHALVHPGFGVALVDVAPDATPNAEARLRRALAAAGFAATCPGYLPVWHGRVEGGALRQLDGLVRDAFADLPPLTLADRITWPEAVAAALAADPAWLVPGQAPVVEALPLAAEPPPPPPRPRRPWRMAAPVGLALAFLAGLGAGLLLPGEAAGPAAEMATARPPAAAVPARPPMGVAAVPRPSPAATPTEAAPVASAAPAIPANPQAGRAEAPGAAALAGGNVAAAPAGGPAAAAMTAPGPASGVVAGAIPPSQAALAAPPPGPASPAPTSPAPTSPDRAMPAPDLPDPGLADPGLADPGAPAVIASLAPPPPQDAPPLDAETVALPLPPAPPPRPTARPVRQREPIDRACRDAVFRFQQGATLSTREAAYLRDGCATRR